MAWKSKKSKKSSTKSDYLDSSLMNEVSEAFNGHMFKFSRGIYPNLDVAKDAFFTEWTLFSSELEKTTSEKVFNSANDKINSIRNLSEQDIFSVGNSILDEFRRQSDIALTKSKNDLINFWVNAAYKNTRNWDVTWLRQIKESEKFLPFFEKDERYIFSGYINQLILNYAMEDYRISEKKPDAQNVVLFMGDIKNLIAGSLNINNETKDDADRIIKERLSSVMKGKKSLTSVFVRTSRAFYKNADGSKWVPSGSEKYPSREDISSGRVIKSEIANYISNPVWLVDTLIDDLPELARKKYQELLEIRSNRDKISIYQIPDNEQNLDQLIDQVINWHIESMSIEVIEGGDSACYFPHLDKINVPVKSDFSNPVNRYAVTVHELAHSTKHLAGRRASSKFGTIPYAIEEIVAESTAMLSVKDLEEKLVEVNGSLPELWRDFFTDYYENSQSYNRHWGTKFDFKGMLDQLFEANDKLKNKKADVFNTLIGDTLNAYKILKTGLYNGEKITPQIRLEKRLENEISSEKGFLGNI